ncbi:MAG TPA: CDP-alcohol phosphatidyltransferase family protein [Coriobacteriia bacterium]|nr:CDP-alcohol phosphatidyltransferase family protein [Coriobacteriia bacterium]
MVEGAVLEESRDTSGPPDDDHRRDVYTLANIITVLRLILVPIFFTVLVSGSNDVVAFLLFALAASTDWLDGQIARRTGTVTEIGKAIDPLVDRLLIAFGVLGVYLQGRVPLWVVLVLLFRDLYLLLGASYLARRRVRALPVIYIGKLTTALLLIGFSDLILNWPQVPGLGLIESPALPGFGSASAAAGIWFVYAGVVTSLVTAGVYTVLAARALSRDRSNSGL